MVRRTILPAHANRPRLTGVSGFSLIELLVVIVVIAMVASIAMQSMTSVGQDTRRTKTEREMEMLSGAIVGQPGLTQDNQRSDFGYIGDVGAFPANLQALYQNPGGFATWDGPYFPPGYTQDSTGFKLDEWGALYTYSGGTTITSGGGGVSIVKRLAAAATDYLQNTFDGSIRDAAGNVPGASQADSVLIVITVPDGSGSSISKNYRPLSSGAFTLDSLPVGRHSLNLIYEPEADTLRRYLTILPRHRSSKTYYFASAHFAPDTSAAGPFLDTILVSTDGAETLGGLDLEDEDVGQYQGPSNAATLFLDGSALFTADENIDAVHLLTNGHLLLSTVGSASLGGLSFDADDVVDYDPVDDLASVVLDGSAVFGNNANIDAISVLPNGHLLVSTSEAETVGALSVSDEDLFEYDVLTGTASLYFNGSGVFTGATDLNAAHVRSDGMIVLSVSDPTAQIGSLSFGREDLVIYDPVGDSAWLYFDGGSFFAGLPADIDAIHVGTGSGCGCWSMIGHWAFNETSGTVAQDSTVYNNDGLLTNMSGSEWAAGTIDGALNFDGTNDHVVIGSSPNIIDSMTVMAWVKPSSVGIDRQIMSDGNGGGMTQWELKTSTSSGKIDFRKWQGGAVGVTSADSLAAGTWTHVASSYDGTSWRIYWDGTLNNTNTATGPVETNRRLMIGAVDVSGSSLQYWSGAIDDVRLYDCVLSNSQINEIYNAGLMIPNLVGHWKLDETSGDTAHDYSGNDNHGVLTNMSGTEWTTGKIGGALEFDGSNDEVIIADDDVLDDTDQLTMAAWVYAHTLDNLPRGPLSKRVTHSSQYSYSMFFYGSDRLNVDINTQNNRFACPTAFNEGQWYHLVVAFDGNLASSVRTKVYVNGSLFHTAYETSSSIPNLNSPLVIGQLNGNTSGFFDGLIDDVRIYDRTLTSSEIQTLYNMGN